MSALLRSTEIDGTIFAPLRDQAVFTRVRVELGAVQWPNGADLPPDAMYDEIKAHGRWVLEQADETPARVGCADEGGASIANDALRSSAHPTRATRATRA